MNLDERPPKPPYVFQEFPKWLTAPNADPDDHASGKTLVRNEAEEKAWHKKHGHFSPEIEPTEEPETAAPETAPVRTLSRNARARAAAGK